MKIMDYRLNNSGGSKEIRFINLKISVNLGMVGPGIYRKLSFK